MSGRRSKTEEYWKHRGMPYSMLGPEVQGQIDKEKGIKKPKGISFLPSRSDLRKLTKSKKFW